MRRRYGKDVNCIMKRFQKLLLILCAVLTVLPCAGLLMKTGIHAVRADFGDFAGGGGGDYGGGGGDYGGGGGDYGGGNYYGGDSDSSSSSSHSYKHMTGKQWAAFGIWFIVIWSAVILRRLWKIHRLGGKITRESIRPYSKRLFIVTPLLSLYLAFILSAATSIKKFIFMICVFGFFASPIFILILRDKAKEKHEKQMSIAAHEKAGLMIPDYSETKMHEWIEKVYTALQKGWQEKDLSGVRQYLDDKSYRKYDMMLEVMYRKIGLTNIITNINVSDIRLADIQQNNGLDVLMYVVTAEITDYVVDDTTGHVVRGSQSARLQMTYRWALTRMHDVPMMALICPCCGTTAEAGSDTACPCCGKPILNGRFDWIITDIQSIRKKTLVPGISS